MGEALDPSALARWRRETASFISDVLIDPETKKPFELLPAERRFLDHAFTTTDDGRLLYPEQIYSAPKKSGKTGFAAMHLLTTTLVFGGAFAEGYAVANDLEQAQGRTYQAARRIVLTIRSILRTRLRKRSAIFTSGLPFAPFASIHIR